MPFRLRREEVAVGAARRMVALAKEPECVARVRAVQLGDVPMSDADASLCRAGQPEPRGFCARLTARAHVELSQDR